MMRLALVGHKALPTENVALKVLAVAVILGTLLGCGTGWERAAPRERPSDVECAAPGVVKTADEVASWRGGAAVLEEWEKGQVDVGKIRAVLPRARLALSDNWRLLVISLPAMTVEPAFDLQVVGDELPILYPQAGLFLSHPHWNGEGDGVLMFVSVAPFSSALQGFDGSRADRLDRMWSADILVRWNVRSGEFDLLDCREMGAAYPCLSPDGKLLSFEVLFRSGGTRLFVADVDKEGIAERKVLDEDVTGYVQWTRDSESFLFSSRCGHRRCQVCRYDIGSGEITRYPIEGTVTLLPGGRSVAVMQSGSVLRVLTYPGLELLRVIPLRHPGAWYTQAVALNDETVAYVTETRRPRNAVVVVGIGEDTYQAPVADFAGISFGLTVIPEQPADAQREEER